MGHSGSKSAKGKSQAKKPPKNQSSTGANGVVLDVDVGPETTPSGTPKRRRLGRATAAGRKGAEFHK